jgi:CubicO group peptidase (beta-lactamase class C family)
MRLSTRAVPLLAVCLGLSCATVAPRPSASPAPVDLAGDWDLRWDRGFGDRQPTLFEGRLHLEGAGSAWTGQLSFRQSQTRLTLEHLTVEGDRLELRLVTPSSREPFILRGWLRDDRIVAEAQWGQIGWTPLGGRRARAARLRDGAVGHSLPHGALSGSGLDEKALKSLLAEAERQDTSAIVIVKDGKVIAEKYGGSFDGGPLVAMSASKSVVNLAVGLLVGSGRLSLETPVSSLFEAWKAGPRAAITVRHLLSHTSGLDPTRTNLKKETILEHAQASPLVFEPGARFQYNNNAVDLLAAVVSRSAGSPMDDYLDRTLFRKLDIVESSWMKDREGTPSGAGELLIRPVDLAKLGQLMLQDGRWNGEQLVPRDWVQLSVEPSQPYAEDCGLLWWREGPFEKQLTPEVLEAWKDLDVEEAIVSGARSLTSRHFTEESEYLLALEQALGTASFAKLKAKLSRADHVQWYGTKASGPAWGFSARGWLGQFLVVIPEHHLVAVRMRAPRPNDYSEDGQERDGYRTFARDVRALVSSTGK